MEDVSTMVRRNSLLSRLDYYYFLKRFIIYLLIFIYLFIFGCNGS